MIKRKTSKADKIPLHLLDRFVVQHYTSEYPVCAKFGCGKRLTDRGYLFSNFCPDCQQKKSISIMDVLKFR